MTGEKLEDWKQQAVEELKPGEAWRGSLNYSVFRYKDGWTVLWANSVSCRDIGRHFDEDHLWTLRLFLLGDWSKGTVIGPQTNEGSLS